MLSEILKEVKYIFLPGDFNIILLNSIDHRPKISDTITVTISEHLPQFHIALNLFVYFSSDNSNTFVRNWLNLNQENFVIDYFSIY